MLDEIKNFPAGLRLIYESPTNYSESSPIAGQWTIGFSQFDGTNGYQLILPYTTSEVCPYIRYIHRDNDSQWYRFPNENEIISNHSINTNGYLLLGRLFNNLIIQWGYINQLGWTSNIHNITLPISHNNYTYYMNIITDFNASSESDYIEPCNYSWLSYVENVPSYNYYSQERVYCSRPWNQAFHRYILICK